MPFLNGGWGESQDTGGSGTKKVGREKHLQSLLQASGSQTGGQLAMSGEVLDVIRRQGEGGDAGGGGRYWHLAGRGQRCCSTPDTAQDSVLHRRIPCQQRSAPSHALEHLQRPLQSSEAAPQTSPIPVSEKFPTQVSSKTAWRDGRERGGDHSGDHEQRCSSAHQQPPTPAREKSQAWAIFGQTGKRKAELKGQPLHPTCPAARVGVLALCTEVHAREQTSGPRSPGGWEEKQAGQAGGRAVARPSLVLNQGLHLVHEVPGQLQDLFGVVSLGHL